MIEPLVDAREMLRGLHERQVEFVLFGAVAMLFHGYVRTDWATLVEEAEVYEVEGQTVQVMNRSTWAELKRRRGSHQDLADIEAIERLAEL